MTFVSGYQMAFYLQEQIYKLIFCNTMVLWSTINIVSKMIEYYQEKP